MTKFLSRHQSTRVVTCVAIEGGLLLSAIWLAHLLRFWQASDLRPGAGRILQIAAAYCLVVLLSLYWNRMYDLVALRTRWEIATKLCTSIGWATPPLWGYYYLVPSLSPGRAVFLISVVLSLLFLAAWRLFLLELFRRRSFAERVLIVGTGDRAKDLARILLARRHLGFLVIGHLGDDPALQGVSIVNPKVIGTTDQVCELALRHHATRVVVAMSEDRGNLNMESLLNCKTSGIPVHSASEYVERLIGQIPLDGLRLSWLIFSEGFVVSNSTLFVKRCLDTAVAVVGLLVTWPILLLTALAIRIDSPGPILYCQERVGRKGKSFTLWKFRSMKVDAELDGEPVWAMENDPRITRVGRLIRRTRIDEIPQLWNVLMGDMSLVGPRPERRPFVESLQQASRFYEERLVVRPGITGWAQISTKYAATIEESLEKLQYDLYYIKNLSVFFDLAIMVRTFRLVMQARKSR